MLYLKATCRETGSDRIPRTKPPEQGMKRGSRRIFQLAVVIACVLAAVIAWRWFQPNPLPEGFARGNGRIEATEIDVATKIAGRVQEILVK